MADDDVLDFTYLLKKILEGLPGGLADTRAGAPFQSPTMAEVDEEKKRGSRSLNLRTFRVILAPVD